MIGERCLSVDLADAVKILTPESWSTRTICHAREFSSLMRKAVPSVVVLGATGRVGRLVAADWTGRGGLETRFQSRGQNRGRNARDAADAGWFFWSLSDGVGRLAEQIGAGVDGLVVLSGVTPAPGAEYRLNSALGLAALAAAREAGVGQVLLASSAAVYGRGTGAALDETAPTLPETDYGRAKLAMEADCLAWQAAQGAGGPALSLLRIGNVAGTDQFFRNLVLATAEAPLVLDRFADGTSPVRSYIGPQTLASVLAGLVRLAAGGRALPQVLNIGAPGGGLDMAAFVPALEQAGLQPQVAFRAAPPGALPVLRLDTRLLASLCPMPSGAALPSTMVAEWLRLRGDAA